MANRSDGSQATSRAILVIAAILVLSALAYFAIKYFSEKSEGVVKDEQIDELQNEVDQLEENIVELQDNIGDVSVNLATKESMLLEKVAELEAVQERLAVARRDNKTMTAQIRKLELRVQELQSLLEEYDDVIIELRAENETLSNQVDSLIVRDRQMTDNLENIQQDRDQTREQLDRTVEVASTLSARDVRFFSFKEGGRNEREFTQLGRWRMKDLKVCFSILPNEIAPQGDRTIYLVIEDGSGNPVTNFTNDLSGRFPYNGQDKVFSASKTISYFGSELEDCIIFYFPEDSRFEKDNYFVSLYADNNLIGEGSFVID